jgi:hypothetical protein
MVVWSTCGLLERLAKTAAIRPLALFDVDRRRRIVRAERSIAVRSEYAPTPCDNG